jgi:hypothetical protein
VNSFWSFLLLQSRSFIIAAIITGILGLHSGEQVRSALEVEPSVPRRITHKVMVGQLAIRYWQVYGPGLFFSSILAGGLIGYVWYRVISPNRIY